MGLWKEAKERKESTLDLEARLAVSGSCIRSAVGKVVGSAGGNAPRVSWGGAVTDRRPLSPCGRVGVLRESKSGLSNSSPSSVGVGESICCPYVSSSVFSSLGTVEGLLDESSRSLVLCTGRSAKETGRCFAFHGRSFVGVFGDSGSSTVCPLLNGHGVRSYCRTFGNTSLNRSATCVSSGELFGSSIR